MPTVREKENGRVCMRSTARIKFTFCFQYYLIKTGNGNWNIGYVRDGHWRTPTHQAYNIVDAVLRSINMNTDFPLLLNSHKNSF